MGSWRKVLISGSNAHIAGITASAITNTGGNAQSPGVEEKVLVYNTSSGAFYFTGSYGQGGGGGSGTPGGNDQNIQFNNGGAFDGDDGFIFDDAQDASLFVDGPITGSIISASGNISASALHINGIAANAINVSSGTGDVAINATSTDANCMVRVSDNSTAGTNVIGFVATGDDSIIRNDEGSFKVKMANNATTTLALNQSGDLFLAGGITASGDISASAGISASVATIVKDEDGGDVTLTVRNSNTDAGLDKNAGIVFGHNTGFKAGKILAGKESTYAGASSNVDSNLKFFTTENATDNERLRIFSNGNISASGNIEITHITASGNISASGDLSGNTVNATTSYNLAGLPVIFPESGKFVFGQTAAISYPIGVTRITGSHIEIPTPLSASIISASGALFTSTSLSASHASNNVVLVNTSTGELYHTGSYGSGGGGTTPTLQQVMDQGSITTVAITSSADISSSANIEAVDGTFAADLTAKDDIFVGDKIMHFGDTGTQIGFNTDFIYFSASRFDFGGAITSSIISASGDLIVSDITLDGDITHAGDTDTKISLTNDQISLHAGSATLTLNISSTTVRPGANQTVSLGATSKEWKEVVTQHITASGEITANTIDVVSNKLAKTSATDADHQGDVVFFGSTVSMDAGKIYHYTSGGVWVLSNATDNTKSTGLLAVALGAVSNTNGMLLKGMVTLDHDPGAVGDELFLRTSDGLAINSAPGGSGNVTRIIGYCLDASNGQIYFNPSNDFIVHA